MTAQEVIDQCKIEGNNVFLPEIQLDRDLYLEVNKKLTGIGGKWNRKAKSHVFATDPSELLGRVKNGEKINLKKDYQFFETPDELADKLVRLLDINNWNENTRVLEPSAGKGALIKALYREHGCKWPVFAIEKMPQNRPSLEAIDRVILSPATDFLSHKPFFEFTHIIANPPFTKNQDIDHVYKMYEVLKKGGRMVSIISNHYQESVNRKEVAFREWLEEKDAEIHNVPMGSFKSSGTLVGGKIIVINK